MKNLKIVNRVVIKIKSKYKWFNNQYNFSDKFNAISNDIAYMSARTQMMFEWHNLPSTVPQEMLEKYLQYNAHCAFIKHNDNYYVVTGGLGGEPDEYYRPTLYTISNPALKYNASLKIDIDCVLIRNDTELMGLYPLHQKYATLGCENDLSLIIADRNTRNTFLLSASDDNTKKSAELYLQQIEQGKTGVIGDNFMFESLRVNPLAQSTNNISQLLEYKQYIKSSWFNELGLNSNFNGMKKEAISDSEKSMNDDILLPLVDNMLWCRQKACEQINNMFGLNISVTLNSAWLDNQQELELEHEALADDVVDDEQETGGDDNMKNDEFLETINSVEPVIDDEDELIEMVRERMNEEDE